MGSDRLLSVYIGPFARALAERKYQRNFGRSVEVELRWTPFS